MVLEIIDKVRTIECNYTNYDLISIAGSTFIIALGKCGVSFSKDSFIEM